MGVVRERGRAARERAGAGLDWSSSWRVSSWGGALLCSDPELSSQPGLASLPDVAPDVAPESSESDDRSPLARAARAAAPPPRPRPPPPPPPPPPLSYPSSSKLAPPLCSSARKEGWGASLPHTTGLGSRPLLLVRDGPPPLFLPPPWSSEGGRRRPSPCRPPDMARTVTVSAGRGSHAARGVTIP
ncbi:hypothetical protein E2C01_066925 [Portunus trituberculatus]|uniref:Uncharacterized protein n=1 Tax=Portunus trituberculatus TaxID=210409 RepID=A0A5B7HW38_PORTR|nr:hypothetical protein [Portunus trituberculatus]